MNERKNLILGAGMTGLAAGISSGLPTYESQTVPGGICSSYYIQPGNRKPLYSVPEGGDAYRFEIGGGHWIFGGDPAVIRFIKSIVSAKSYNRESGVFFSKKGLFVPYPIQNHLGFLGREIATKALSEILNAPKGKQDTMADWLEQNFGKTLMEIFFAPFHELYTSGLWTRIAPQDAYKSPVRKQLVIQGAKNETSPEVGYNVTYLYPEEGLNSLAQRMGGTCDVKYEKRVERIDLGRREVSFSDGSGVTYKNIISTLPLNKVIEMSGLELEEEPDCYTSVLVLNIGAKKGEKCPDHHWLYIPDSRSKFHRVGFYSNVDDSFLPIRSRKDKDRVSIYVERAFPNGEKPSTRSINNYSRSVVSELQAWGFIDEAEVVDPTWIDVAYTWSMPGSKWKEKALKELENHNIFQIGRYGRWVFQGIADSIKDGLFVGSAIGRV